MLGSDESALVQFQYNHQVSEHMRKVGVQSFLAVRLVALGLDDSSVLGRNTLCTV